MGVNLHAGVFAPRCNWGSRVFCASENTLGSCVISGTSVALLTKPTASVLDQVSDVTSYKIRNLVAITVRSICRLLARCCVAVHWWKTSHCDNFKKHSGAHCHKHEILLWWCQSLPTLWEELSHLSGQNEENCKSYNHEDSKERGCWKQKAQYRQTCRSQGNSF